MTHLPSKDPRDSRKVNYGQRTLYKQRLSLNDADFEQPRRLFQVQDILPKVMKRMGLEKRAQREELQKIWPQIVGPLLAQHSRPGNIERGSLTIYITHSIWLVEMKTYGEKNILKKLNALSPSKPLRRIRLQLDPQNPSDQTKMDPR